MTMRFCLFFSTFIVLTLFSTLFLPLIPDSHASDIRKEQRMAEQLTEQLVIGEAVNITAGSLSFFALYTPAEGKTQRGGVILLHGQGAHPDWPDVISPLRRDLPDSGWATLAIQLPVWPNGTNFTDYLPLFPAANVRIDAAVRYLQKQGLLNITLVGHSLGAAMGAHYLAQQPPGSDAIRAFVGVGMGSAPGTVAHTPDALAKINIPVLDLYGFQDLDNVLNSAKARAQAAQKANNTAYRQIKVTGADHFFRALEATLTKRIAGWLTLTAPSTQMTKKPIAKP